MTRVQFPDAEQLFDVNPIFEVFSGCAIDILEDAQGVIAFWIDFAGVGGARNRHSGGEKFRNKRDENDFFVNILSND